jgi:hypothetical protein
MGEEESHIRGWYGAGSRRKLRRGLSGGKGRGSVKEMRGQRQDVPREQIERCCLPACLPPHHLPPAAHLLDGCTASSCS